MNDEVDPFCPGNTDLEQATGRIAADEHRQVIELEDPDRMVGSNTRYQGLSVVAGYFSNYQGN